ncbi:MAG: phosphoribosylglycinamide formyltransferase [Candidatus Dormibacteraeota bacterium]|nr:phosphoribosylglycinamide formyltransferase [Candidatus Dormibacteraeota bacterium]MBO0745031.1 phosphoribosylglycinamide formyltransferase [Candidatus Dormibacteraeota bacterium]
MTGASTKARLAVLASGRGTNLEHLAGLGYPIVGVATNRPSSGAAEIARARGLPLGEFPQSRYRSRADRDATMLAWLRERDPQVVVLAGYDRIVAPGMVRAFRGRIVNLHPSLLPAFAGGMDAVALALRAGVKITGCTVHLVTEDVDGGPILRQAAVEVLPGDTEETLHQRIQVAERRILPLAIDDVFATLGVS